MPRRRKIVLDLAAVGAVVAVLAAVWVTTTIGDLNERMDEGAACAQSSPLLSSPVSSPATLPVLELEARTVKAGAAADEMRSAQLGPAPWGTVDGEASVVRCASGTVVWFVDDAGRRSQIDG